MHIYPTMRNSTIPRPVTIDRGPRIYLSMKGDVGNIVKWMVVRLRRRTGSFASSAVYDCVIAENRDKTIGCLIVGTSSTGIVLVDQKRAVTREESISNQRSCYGAVQPSILQADLMTGTSRPISTLSSALQKGNFSSARHAKEQQHHLSSQHHGSTTVPQEDQSLHRPRRGARSRQGQPRISRRRLQPPSICGAPGHTPRERCSRKGLSRRTTDIARN